jgi:hypothetical protein
VFIRHLLVWNWVGIKNGGPEGVRRLGGGIIFIQLIFFLLASKGTLPFPTLIFSSLSQLNKQRPGKQILQTSAFL